jgi:hypothetical protein
MPTKSKSSTVLVLIEHINYMCVVRPKQFYAFDASGVNSILFFRRFLIIILTDGLIYFRRYKQLLATKVKPFARK